MPKNKKNISHSGCIKIKSYIPNLVCNLNTTICSLGLDWVDLKHDWFTSFAWILHIWAILRCAFLLQFYKSPWKCEISPGSTTYIHVFIWTIIPGGTGSNLTFSGTLVRRGRDATGHLVMWSSDLVTPRPGSTTYYYPQLIRIQVSIAQMCFKSIDFLFFKIRFFYRTHLYFWVHWHNSFGLFGFKATWWAALCPMFNVPWDSPLVLHLATT